MKVLSCNVNKEIDYLKIYSTEQLEATATEGVYVSTNRSSTPCRTYMIVLISSPRATRNTRCVLCYKPEAKQLYSGTPAKGSEWKRIKDASVIFKIEE